MAKRVRINQGSTGQTAMEKLYHTQELLAYPENDTLRKIDIEMGDLLEKANLSVSDKVRLFEEKLAQYRQIQKKIFLKGGVSGVADHIELKSVIKNVLEEMLHTSAETMQEDPDEAKMISLEGHSGMPGNRTPEFKTPTYFQDSQGTAESSPVASAGNAIQQTPKLVQAAVKRKSASTSPVQAARTPQSNIKKELKELLRTRAGFEINNGKVNFRLGDSEKLKKNKRSQYAQSTYDQAIDFITKDKIVKTPGKVQGLLKVIHKNMQHQFSPQVFNKYLREYPNLKNLHIKISSPAAVLPSVNWSELVDE
jgi:hypothetical protein